MKDEAIKLVVIGESGVGKSSLLRRFTENQFNENHEVTIGMSLDTKEIEINGSKYKVAIWDTAGTEKFRSLTPSFYRNAHGAILVYDVTCRESLLRLESWHTELHNYSDIPNIALVVIGNKIDMERIVTREEGFKFARKHRALFIETSAKNDQFVTDAFLGLIEKIVSSENFGFHHANTVVVSEGSVVESNWKCC